MQRFAILLLLGLVACPPVQAKSPFSSPFSLVSFKRSKEIAKSSSLLTEDNGPWMIFVASFAGEAAEMEARQLVETLRSKFHLQAYLHRQKYDFTKSVKGKGFDMYGKPKKMRFHSADAFEEFAVLVGDYTEIDDPKLEKHLDIIKHASAEQLSLRGSKDNPTTRRFATLRSIQKKLSPNKEKKQRGPLRTAFKTRNPLQPQGESLDNIISKELLAINEGVKYSLLKNPGKYTVRVASFRGQVVIDQKKIFEIEQEKATLDGRIHDTAKKAEAMTKILREKHGVDAYVYHDYHESIVTVGSFENIGTELRDGSIDLNPAVAEVMETYGPTKKPIQGAPIAVSGIQPKRLQEGAEFLFEIAPQPIFVPQKPTDKSLLSRR